MIDKTKRKNSDFKEFIGRVFDKYRNSPAIAFRPVFMDDCRDKPLQSRFNNYKTINSTSGRAALSIRDDYSPDLSYRNLLPYDESSFILPR
jgi:hypothetical protein